MTAMAWWLVRGLITKLESLLDTQSQFHHMGNLKINTSSPICKTPFGNQAFLRTVVESSCKEALSASAFVPQHYSGLVNEMKSI